MRHRLGSGIPFHPEVKQNRGLWRAEFGVALQPGRVVFVSIPSLYSPVPYAPQAFAVAALAPFQPSPVVLLYAARAANLLVWIALLYAALVIAPAHRWSLFVLAVAPMSLFIAASASPDALTNGLAFVWVALMLHVRAQRKPLSNRAAVGLWLLASSLGLCKLIYWALVALLLLLPANLFRNGRQRMAILGAIGLGSLTPTLTWFALASGFGGPDPWVFC